MQFSTVTLLSAFAAAASAATHSIDVGKSGFTFSPVNISAAPGDTVVFSFYPNKHSVAQASFGKPCVPLNTSSFFSGALTTTSGSVNTETFTLTVNDTTPIWFYCSVASHCASGMVGSINAVTTGAKTIDAYILAAKNTTNTTAPATVQGGVLSAASSTSSNSSSNSSSSDPPPSNSSSTSNTTKNAGVETRGSVQWTTLVFTGLMAAAFGGLLV